MMYPFCPHVGHREGNTAYVANCDFVAAMIFGTQETRWVTQPICPHVVLQDYMGVATISDFVCAVSI